MYNQIHKNGDRTPTFVEYPDKFKGLIYTFMDRFQFNQVEYDQVMTEWNKHKSTLKVKDKEAQALFQLQDEVLPNYIKSHEIEQEFSSFAQAQNDDEE